MTNCRQPTAAADQVEPGQGGTAARNWRARLLVGLALLAIGYAIGSTVEHRRWAAEKAVIARDVLYLKDYIKELRSRLHD